MGKKNDDNNIGQAKQNKDKQDKNSLKTGQTKDTDLMKKKISSERDDDMELTKEYVNEQNSKEDVSTEEMQKYLRLDGIKPITANSTDGQDKQEKGDCFDEWYAEELKEIYKRCK